MGHIGITLWIPLWYCAMFIYDELHRHSTIFLVVSVVGSTVILLGMLSLMLSFNRILFIVISKENNNRFCDRPSMDRSSELTQLSDIQQSLLAVVTKQTLLVSAMLFGGIVFLIAIVFVSVLRGQETASTEWAVY